jgi:hypothetical protein
MAADPEGPHELIHPILEEGDPLLARRALAVADEVQESTQVSLETYLILSGSSLRM